MFNGDVDVGATEVLMLGEIGGETAICATCGGIFGDTKTFGENTDVELTIWIDRFGAEEENSLSG